VFGQSAGAASIAFLTAAPAAKGLFRRAIAQSIPAGSRSAAEAESVTTTLAAAAGVPATREGFAGLAPDAILAVQDAPLTGRDNGFTAFGPVIDGDLVTGPPWVAIPAGRRVDLICGFTHDEYLGHGQPPAPAGVDLGMVAERLGLTRDSADAYRHAHPDNAGVFVAMLSDALVRMPTMWVAEAHARAGGRTWLYDFAWRSPTMGAAAHGLDVPFIFGNPGSRFAARFLGSPPPADFGPLSDQIRAAWTTFAATGDPGWPRYDLETRRTRIWDTTPSDAIDPLAESRRIWERVAGGYFSS
jgi:para-nitrobenzyl esterase